MNRCTLGRLLGGTCDERRDLLAVLNGEQVTHCGTHAEIAPRFLAELLRRREPGPPPRCHHRHRSAEARRQCEARLAARAAI
jgi:hypothetical protein